jgi:radical SAM protein with 4Fe4S-binding SPASM domain
MPLPSLRRYFELAYHHPRYMENLLFEKLRSFERYRWLDHHDTDDDRVPEPLIYKLVLTYRCNLRCAMCYEWGSVGWCKEEPAAPAGAGEMDWSLVEKLMASVGASRPSFVLSGGEPLLYSRYRDLAGLLKKHRCFSITCTNGLLLESLVDVIADNPYLTWLVSLDGIGEENDRLRGKGVYDRVLRGVRTLKSLRHPPYLGISFTIRPENVAGMFRFCEEMVREKVDWILLNPSWFLSEQQGRDYETFLEKHFGVHPRTHRGYMQPYPIDKEEFVRQFRRIQSERWPIQISSYLRRPEDIYTFVDRPEVPPGNTFCYKQWLRMDITPEGDVTPCILYPDLVLGNLRDQDPLELWNNEAHRRFRELRREEVLPICAKCNALYLHDARRKYL